LTSLLEGNRDLRKCFGIFHEIHKLISTRDILKRVLMEVLEDFMADNVIYLELRSTPRTLEGNIVINICNTIVFASNM
jgi:adenosine deaminase